MSGKESGARRESSTSRSDSIWSALVLGLPLSAGVLFFLNQPRFEGTLVAQYLHHPIEYVEITFFCCCVAALLSKWWGCLRQRRALRRELLPPWDGKPQVLAEAAGLLAGLSQLPRSVRQSWVARRCRGVLDFLCRRGSAAGLDDHIRFAGDNDVMALEASYSFPRFLIWATPILGFLGTVIGISKSIAGVSPEQLEQGLSAITGGLATAFDTTGLALMLTLVMMLISFVVERGEQKTMQEVDDYVEEQLFHRFARQGGDNGPLLEAMEQMVKKQADVWAASLAEMDSHAHAVAVEQQDRLTEALKQALDRSLAGHEEHVARTRRSLHEQTVSLLRSLAGLAASLKPTAEIMRELGQTLAGMREGEGELVRLQTLLQQNLQALAAAGSFEEAVHSMMAAAHLLSARSGLKQTLRRADDGRAAA